jgi:hypothetical protein
MAYNNMQPDTLLQVGQELIVRPPTETPLPTPTLTPEATPIAEGTSEVVVALQVLPTLTRPPAPTAAAPTATPSPNTNGPDWSWLFGIGAMIAAFGLTALAVVAIFVIRRDA